MLAWVITQLSKLFYAHREISISTQTQQQRQQYLFDINFGHVFAFWLLNQDIHVQNKQNRNTAKRCERRLKVTK